MKSRKYKYIPGYLNNKMKEILKKIGLRKGLLDYIQVKIFLSWTIMIYQRLISNVNNAQDNCGTIFSQDIEKTTAFSEVIEKITKNLDIAYLEFAKTYQENW